MHYWFLIELNTSCKRHTYDKLGPYCEWGKNAEKEKKAWKTIAQKWWTRWTTNFPKARNIASPIHCENFTLFRYRITLFSFFLAKNNVFPYKRRGYDFPRQVQVHQWNFWGHPAQHFPVEIQYLACWTRRLFGGCLLLLLLLLLLYLGSIVADSALWSSILVS